ncbi:uncharacterized protein LOC133032090 [Cannabis sativa]|uniref:uncharacterized protein LOC133032090 n=1 Tax=Cannabis sativa TaxID=3483 RepID=UPI0029C9B9F2|nr:uncharacterized protein LOC133032090 [Cannabis sativa]
MRKLLEIITTNPQDDQPENMRNILVDTRGPQNPRNTNNRETQPNDLGTSRGNINHGNVQPDNLEDQFSWSHSDLVRIIIDPNVIRHHLNIDISYPRKHQKVRPLDPKRQNALKGEIDKLLTNNFITEAFYSTWILNPVLVPKLNETWRTCIDFSDLNKACSKDCFQLPKIDQLVDVIAKYELVTSMEVNAGIDEVARKVGLGATIHDRHGLRLAFAASLVQGILSPLLAEVLAIPHGLQLCFRLDFMETEVESDSQ